ncbi:hypothetical protein [Streptomyces sp. NPDC003327]
MTLLDCTLRTGGRLIGGAVPPAPAADYLAVCARIGIDVVELGTVHDPDGPGGRPGDPLLAPLHRLRASGRGAHGPRFSVLLDTALLPGTDAAAAAAAGRIADVLATAAEPVGLVRLSVPYDRVARVAAPLHRLRAAGHGVCLCLTGIDLASPPELDRTLAEAAGLGPLDAVFLVDSLGSFRPERVVELVRATRAAVPAPVGVHARDNLGLALHNTVVAGSAGATWQVASAYGVDRGAGLTRTEQLLALRGAAPADLAPLLAFVADRLVPLKRRYGWGAGPREVMAGLARVPVDEVREFVPC